MQTQTNFEDFLQHQHQRLQDQLKAKAVDIASAASLSSVIAEEPDSCNVGDCGKEEADAETRDVSNVSTMEVIFLRLPTAFPCIPSLTHACRTLHTPSTHDHTHPNQMLWQTRCETLHQENQHLESTVSMLRHQIKTITAAQEHRQE